MRGLKTYCMGYDCGNSQAKAVIYDGQIEHSLLIPSATTDGTLHKLAEARRATGTHYSEDAEVLEPGEYVLSFNHGLQEHFVGELAFTEDPNAHTGRGNVNRYWSARIRELCFTLAGATIHDKEYNLYVVTGLPARTFSSENAMKVTTALAGTYTYTLNGYTQTVHIDVARVLQEGAGASIVLATDSTGYQGVIDIGGFSTDLYVCQNMKVVGNYTSGIEVGVERIIDIITSWYQREYRTDTPLPAYYRMDILKAFATRHEKKPHPYPTLSVQRRTIPAEQVQGWAEEAVKIIGDMINEGIGKTWKGGSQGDIAQTFDPVYVVGGGAYYFLDEIRTIIPKAIQSKKPELENVRGYAKVAKRLYERQQEATRNTFPSSSSALQKQQSSVKKAPVHREREKERERGNEGPSIINLERRQG